MSDNAIDLKILRETRLGAKSKERQRRDYEDKFEERLAQGRVEHIIKNLPATLLNAAENGCMDCKILCLIPKYRHPANDPDDKNVIGDLGLKEIRQYRAYEYLYEYLKDQGLEVFFSTGSTDDLEDYTSISINLAVKLP